MAYGALVIQLIQDYEDYGEVNKQLEKMYVSLSRCLFRFRVHRVHSHSRYPTRHLSVTPPYRGYNIGMRLIEDFLARAGLGRCSDFKEVGEVVAKVRFGAL